MGLPDCSFQVAGGSERLWDPRVRGLTRPGHPAFRANHDLIDERPAVVLANRTHQQPLSVVCIPGPGAIHVGDVKEATPLSERSMSASNPLICQICTTFKARSD